MDRRGHPKPKITHALGFKLAYRDRGYECVGQGGSLKVGCRRLLYCPECDAPECLFGGPTFKQIQAGAKPGTEKRVVSAARHELYSRSAKRNVEKKRAKGLTPGGIPLREVCYNCVNLRRDHTGFICPFRPLDGPLGESTVRKRSAAGVGCQSFEMRLVMEIPELVEVP